MADSAIAITAIIVSGVVGPTLAAWWTRMRQREDHEHELRRELREVLDQGAQALGRAKRASDNVWNLQRHGTDRSDPTAIQAFAEHRARMQEVRDAEDRIAIRLGIEHPIHGAFARVYGLLETQREFARAFKAGRPLDELADLSEKAHEDFEPARRSYLAAAKHVVGPRMGTPSGDHLDLHLDR